MIPLLMRQHTKQREKEQEKEAESPPVHKEHKDNNELLLPSCTVTRMASQHSKRSKTRRENLKHGQHKSKSNEVTNNEFFERNRLAA